VSALNMTQTAAELGYAYRTFRREWPDLVLAHGFPSPILPHRWDAAAVRAWKAERSQRPANDHTPPRAEPAEVSAARARAAFHKMRREA
jgi:hypothetical protein